MSPDEEPPARDQRSGAHSEAAAAAGHAQGPGRGQPGRAGEAGTGGRGLPRRAPATRQPSSPLMSSPRLSVEQLTKLRECLARLKPAHQPPPEDG